MAHLLHAATRLLVGSLLLPLAVVVNHTALLVVAANNVFAGKTNVLAGKQPRIVGGEDAPLGAFPYLVDLDGNGGDHACMGSLVATDMVLCAAHCEGLAIFARIGRHDRQGPAEDYDGLLVEKEIVHPLYFHYTIQNDFMLMKLAGRSDKEILRLNKDPTVPVNGQELYVAGFGDVDPDPNDIQIPDILQQTTVRAITNEVCSLGEGRTEGQYASYSGMIGDNMLCTQGDPGRDTCQGDSGGPVILKGESPDQDIQVGIVSWGYGCGEDFAGVNSRISFAYDWIRAVVCQESAAPPTYLDCDDGTANLPPINFPPKVDDPIEFVFEFATDVYSDVENYIFVQRVEGLNVELVQVFRSGEFPVADVYRGELSLEKGRLYSFTLADEAFDGVNGGEVKLFLRDTDGELVQIRSLDTFDFGENWYTVVLFYAAFEEPEQPFYKDKELGDGSALSLEISHDITPNEIGVEIRFSNGTLLFYRPPGYYYAIAEGVSTEDISFPDQPHDYTLAIVDWFGDGLGDSKGTGYRLGNGSIELVASTFKWGKVETTSFTWPVPRLQPLPPKKDRPEEDEMKDDSSKVFREEMDQGGLGRSRWRTLKLKGS